MNGYENDEIIGIEFKNICQANEILEIFSYYSPDDTLNQELIEHIKDKYKNFIIIGDLNAISSWHGMKKTNKNGRVLIISF